MDGTLYLWCGPFQRWQERYGVINNGLLDIYLSKDSKNVLESICLTTANVSPVANSPIEWIIQAPAKSSAYFKVSQAKERRRWLKLIGSVKACIADSSVLINRENTPLTVSDSRPTTSNEERDLRPEIPSYKASSILPVKQDLQYSESRVNEDGVNQSIFGCVKKIQFFCDDLKSEVTKLQAQCVHNPEFDVVHYLQKKEEEISTLLTDIKHTITSVTSQTGSHENYSLCNTDFVTSDNEKISHTTDIPSCSESHDNVTIVTFFTGNEVSFTDVMREALGDPEPSLLCTVHSQTLIDACINHAKFFDIFAATLFSPLKNDILSNAEKVRRVFMKDCRKYVYLERIIEEEVRRKRYMHPDSASQAIIWIMRGLRTVSRFLIVVCSRTHPLYKDTSQALGLAYQEHLCRYHNFIVQKMFSAALRLLPSMEHFKKQVIMNKNLDVSSKAIEHSIMQQATAYSQSAMEMIQAIEKIFRSHKIDL